MSTDEPAAFDLARIVEVFNAHGVTYIAIGGVSGMLHGAVHYVTQDVDLMVQPDPANLERIVQAGRLGQEMYSIVVALLVAVFAMEQFTATWFYRTDESAA